jgi:3-oxoacyl-[acyl-carrier-protein] synthase III
MDDLPDRMLKSMPSDTASKTQMHEEDVFVMPVQLEIEAYGVVDYPGDDEPDTVTLLAKAADACLKRSEHDRNEMDLLIAACTYRSEFLMEPAIAALTAGVLGMNDDREPQDEKKTFAFDVTNGEVGFLKSVFLASELTRVGRAKKVMVLASEVENNIARRPDHIMGVRSMASAVILREATSDSGFLCFGFSDFTNHDKLREVHAGWHADGSRIYLTCNDDGDIWPILMDCLIEGTKEFLTKNDLSLSEIDWVLPTQHSEVWIHGFADQMAIDRKKLVDLKPDQKGNPLSSALPLALEQGRDNGQFRSGDLILIASVCPGVQVGCAVYRI